MRLATVGLNFNTSCPKCGESLCLTKVEPQIHCPTCGEDSIFSKELWFEYLTEHISQGIDLNQGKRKGKMISMSDFGSPMTIYATRQEFCCPFCNSKQHDVLLSAIERKVNIFNCRSCGKELSWREPPSWLPVINKHLICFAGEHDMAHQTFTSGEIAPVLRQENRKVKLETPKKKMAGKWYAVLEMGRGKGFLPEKVFQVYDVKAASNGDFFVIYLDYGGDEKVLRRCNREGMIKWTTKKIVCEGDPVLHVYKDSDDLLVVDPEGKEAFLVNGKDGYILDKIKNEKVFQPEALNYGHTIFGACDFNNSFIFKNSKPDSDKYHLHRYDKVLQEIPLWPGMKGNKPSGFLDRVLGKAPGPVKLAWDDQIQVGWDRNFYVLGKTKMTKYDLEGKELESCKIELENLDYVVGFGVDKKGFVYLAYRLRHMVEYEYLIQIARRRPGEDFKVWIDPLSKDDPVVVNKSIQFMSVDPDGYCFIGNNKIDSLKIFDPKGNKIFINEAIRQKDFEESKAIKAAIRESGLLE